MGRWGDEPWDSDEAADWYAGMMDATKLRDHVMKAIAVDDDEDLYWQFEEVHAAITVFLMLGRVYIWPIEAYDDDLQAMIAAAKRLKGVVAEIEEEEEAELFTYLDEEIAILETRLDPNRPRPPAAWPWGMD